MEIISYLVGHTDYRTMLFTKSYDQIRRDLGVSRAVIAETFKKLNELGLIEKKGAGVWLNHMIAEGSNTSEGFDYYFDNLQYHK